MTPTPDKREDSKTAADYYMEEAHEAAKINEKFGKVVMSDAIRKFTMNCLMRMERDYAASHPRAPVMVEESIIELMAEAKELVAGLLPGEDYGESPEAERLWNILEQVQASDFVIKEDSLMQLYEDIKHGDDNHQIWLKEKMIDWLRKQSSE